MSLPTQLPTHTCLFISSSSSSVEKFLLHICKDKFPAVLSSSIPHKVGFYQLISHSQETEGWWEPLHLRHCSLAEETLTYKLLVTLQCRPYNELKENPVFCFDCSNVAPLTNLCFLRNTHWALILCLCSESNLPPTYTYCFSHQAFLPRTPSKHNSRARYFPHGALFHLLLPT